MFKEMDCFLAMSEDMKRDAIALGAPERKIIVHYHGINAQRFRYDERTYCAKKRFTILCVGTLEGKKGQHHLLRAVAELRRVRPDIDAHVVLVGEGPLQKELKQIVKREGLSRIVTMTGFVQHLNPKFLQYYRDADVFVHFSTTQRDNDKEGIPGTIVEAMAAGLPVVATHHAGIPEAIAHGIHGVLLEEHDIAGITKSLIALYESEEMRAKLGRAAARRALNDLDVRTKTRSLERIYDSVAQRDSFD
jgi:colanic acid/amylovoran biosynthesis glycosyltransferase